MAALRDLAIGWAAVAQGSSADWESWARISKDRLQAGAGWWGRRETAANLALAGVGWRPVTVSHTGGRRFESATAHCSEQECAAIFGGPNPPARSC
ncbi:MAG: hypothetical protein ACYTBS_23010 [Planctomycetota bacterium]